MGTFCEKNKSSMLKWWDGTFIMKIKILKSLLNHYTLHAATSSISTVQSYLCLSMKLLPVAQNDVEISTNYFKGPLHMWGDKQSINVYYGFKPCIDLSRLYLKSIDPKILDKTSKLSVPWKLYKDIHWGWTISLTFSPHFMVEIAFGKARQRWSAKIKTILETSIVKTK